MALLPRGLVFNPQYCSVLVLSSNCNAGGGNHYNQLNSDQSAQAIFSSALKASGVVQDSMGQLVITEGATKLGLEGAIQEQLAKITEDEEGLFIFAYSGGVCNLVDCGLAFRVSESEEEGFMNVDFNEANCTHSLVLKDFDPQRVESYVSGRHIADVILSSSTKPKQMVVILDCPYAQEISQDLENHLKDQLECELIVMVSQGTDKVPHCLRPLGTSTFSYFFSKFLAEESSRTEAGTHATLYLRSMYAKVSSCCEALSNLRMVRDGLTLKPSGVIPEARLVHVVRKIMERMEQTEQTEGNVEADGGGEDQVDSEEESKVGKFLQKYFKRGFFTPQVRLCDQAKDWVQAVQQGPLVTLMDQGELKGKVLLAAVGSMMSSVAKIQKGCEGSSITNSNIFILAYIHVFAAVSIHIPDLEISDPSLLKEALESYTEVLNAMELSKNEINQLEKKLKNQ